MSLFSSVWGRRRLLPRLSSRFHISMGLSSLLGSVVLLSIYLGLVPDRQANLALSRANLSESVSALGSVLLRNGDISGIRHSLTFITEQNPDLHSIVLTRSSDNSQFEFTSEISNTSGSGSATAAIFEVVKVPVLRGNKEWGRLVFNYRSSKNDGWIAQYRDSPFFLIMFIGLVSFPLFYLFLGKMLKELNPSAAVPSRVRSALDTIAEALLVVDTRGDVVLANSAFAELTGKSPDALLGVAANSLPWANSEADGKNVWDSALQNAESTRHDKIGFVDDNDKVRTFIVNCSPVLGSGDKAGGVLISMDDVTVLQEQELLLRDSMQNAERANLAKSTFLSTMSHEIRTPMTAILGFTDVLKRGLQQTESERQKYLDTISSSGHHLLELINDVLDLSKVESGAMEVEVMDCDWVSIVNEVVHTLRVKATEKAISLDMEIDSDIPQSIKSDPSRLRQIITNLVGNAIKFTDQGKVQIRLSFDESEDGNGHLYVRVVDSGIGMSPQQQASIFDAFTQADASITRRFGGTGLGLSISRELAIAMGGLLEVTSEEGVGSTFHLSLPLKETVLDLKKPAEILSNLDAVSQRDKISWSFPASRILVVDDGQENRQLLSIVLADLKIDVSLAENGQQALDIINASSFDVVLMDIQMPVMDGFEAAKRMRANGIDLPIVALTANAMKGFETKILAAGFSHYMTKPIDLDKLIELLALLLGGQKNVQQVSVDAPDPETGKNQCVSLSDDSTDLRSPFLEKDHRYAEIVLDFKNRLAERLEEMQDTISNDDWDQLAELGHWLKGSAAMVGIEELVEPGKQIESAAKLHDRQSCEKQYSIIESLQSRIVTDMGHTNAPSGAEGRAFDPELAELPDNTVKELTLLDKSNTNGTDRADNSIRSTLPVHQADFFSVVDEFIEKLREQQLCLREAVLVNDFANIAELAHWFRGSGGNMGFSGFIPLADSLENSALENNAAIAVHSMNLDNFIEKVVAGWELEQSRQHSA